MNRLAFLCETANVQINIIMNINYLQSETLRAEIKRVAIIAVHWTVA